MKKLVSILMALVVCLTTSTVWGADKICGKVLNTDIKAYINGLPIKSYNINGWTGVVAEDLRDYGFNVEWNAEERSLYVGGVGYTSAPTANYQFKTYTKPIGSIASYVYETDIKTTVLGNSVNAFNIGGWTIIYIDELQAFGDVVWNENNRTISYTYREPWSITLQTGEAGKNHEGRGPYKDGIKSVSATFNKNETGSFDIWGENLEHLSWINIAYEKRYGGLQLGFSMIAHHLLADYDFSQLCYEMVNINYDGTKLKENTDFTNEHMRIFINDIPVKIKEVRMGKGNNHNDYYFVLDIDIPKEQINKISIECSI